MCMCVSRSAMVQSLHILPPGQKSVKSTFFKPSVCIESGVCPINRVSSLRRLFLFIFFFPLFFPFIFFDSSSGSADLILYILDIECAHVCCSWFSWRHPRCPANKSAPFLSLSFPNIKKYPPPCFSRNWIYKTNLYAPGPAWSNDLDILEIE